MKVKMFKKIICSVLLILMILSFGLNNFSNALSIDNAYLQKIGEADKHLKYNGSYVKISIVGHYTNGNFYPAYCMNKDLPGAETSPYNVSITQILDNDAVWRVVTNGFPYKTAAQMGLANDFDAFAVTKMAVYCITGQSDLGNFSADSNDGTAQAMLGALHNLVNIGLNGSGTQRQGTLAIDKQGSLYEDGNYYSQNFSASSSVEIANYTITNITGFPEGTVVANLSGGAQNSFGPNEVFKIMIPKQNLVQDVKGNIYATSRCKIYPIFYGDSGNSSTQNYVITYDPYGDSSTVSGLEFKADTAKINVYKKDDYTHKGIEGVTFGLYKDNNLIATGKTNSDGFLEFKNLYQGNYTLKEIEANSNYILNDKTFDITTEFNKTSEITIENEHKKGNLKVYKIDKDNNRVVLGNVEFDLYSEEFGKVIGSYKTDVNGEIYIENLRIGNYSLIEKETNRWYNLADDTTDIKIEWNLTTDSKIENELKKGQIRIIKIDKDNNEVKLEGVEFEIYDENNNLLETIITDENGEATTGRYAIRDFEKLIVKEKSTLENYKLNDEEQTIILEENQITNITFENEKKKGQIEIIKVDKDNNEVKLEGVKFNIIGENGELIQELITDENGQALSDRLPIDQEYSIVEVETNEKYVLNDETIKIVLEEDQISTLTFENEVRKGQIEIIKVDKEDNEVRLEGVTFEILNSSGEVVDTIITDNEGKALSNRLSIYDEYTIREKETLKEYVLSEETQKVVLEENEITSMTFENEKIKGSIKIIKKSVDGNILQGAKFIITNTETNEVLGLYETNEEGIIELNDLTYGAYKIEEYEAPAGFIKDTQIYEVSILENGQIIELEVVNSPIIIEELPKTGYNYDFYIITTMFSLVIFLNKKILNLL